METWSWRRVLQIEKIVLKFKELATLLLFIQVAETLFNPFSSSWGLTWTYQNNWLPSTSSVPMRPLQDRNATYPHFTDGKQGTVTSRSLLSGKHLSLICMQSQVQKVHRTEPWLSSWVYRAKHEICMWICLRSLLWSKPVSSMCPALTSRGVFN